MTSILTTLLSGTIAKGKKKRVLEVDLTLTDTSNTANGMGVVAYVNGVQMEPSSSLFQLSECPGASWNSCTVSGHFWLDLDAAETANPGVFINQPLVINMVGVGDGNFTAAGSLRAHLQKK